MSSTGKLLTVKDLHKLSNRRKGRSGPQDEQHMEALYDAHSQTAAVDADFCVGALYSSNAGLEQAVESFQQQNCVQFYKRDSRTVEAYLKR